MEKPEVDYVDRKASSSSASSIRFWAALAVKRDMIQGSWPQNMRVKLFLTCDDLTGKLLKCNK